MERVWEALIAVGKLSTSDYLSPPVRSSAGALIMQLMNNAGFAFSCSSDPGYMNSASASVEERSGKRAGLLRRLR